MTPIIHPLNERLHRVYKSIFLDTSGDQASELFLNSRKADLILGTFYYARPEEMAARAFEAYVEDTGPQNSFLVRGSRHSEEARAGLYPAGEQRETINAAFGEYFSALGFALRQ